MARSVAARPLRSRGAGLTTRDFGRNLFGLAAIAFGAFEAAATANAHARAAAGIPLPVHDTIVYVSAIAQIFGGIAIQWNGTKRLASAMLLSAYGLYCVLFVPPIVRSPLIFSGWGDLFEPLTMVAAALILLARSSRPERSPRAALEIGRLLFALCVVTFALYQAFYIAYTASLVPKWIPPGQVFWAIATTVAFALAALALFLRRTDRLAARLLTLMLLLFQVLIWIPAVIVHPRSAGMWAENVLNLAIAASCWVVADALPR